MTKRADQVGSIIGALIGLVLAYALVSRAFDTGSYWQYGGTLLLLIFSVKLVIRVFRNGKQ